MLFRDVLVCKTSLLRGLEKKNESSIKGPDRLLNAYAEGH